jgi:hypothetical protein
MIRCGSALRASRVTAIRNVNIKTTAPLLASINVKVMLSVMHEPYQMHAAKTRDLSGFSAHHGFSG